MEKKNENRLLYKKFEKRKLPTKYYIDKKNDVLMKWVYPYIKGKGILTDNIYNVKIENK